MHKLENWTEITRGLYRYVISAKVCYEIHVLYHEYGTDILTSNASLFIVGVWNGERGGYFERECLLKGNTFFQCLNMARKDYNENCE